MDRLSLTATNHLHPRKEPKYYQCWTINKAGVKLQCIGENNSLRLLRHKHGLVGVIYITVR